MSSAKHIPYCILSKTNTRSEEYKNRAVSVRSVEIIRGKKKRIGRPYAIKSAPAPGLCAHFQSRSFASQQERNDTCCFRFQIPLLSRPANTKQNTKGTWREKKREKEKGSVLNTNSEWQPLCASSSKQLADPRVTDRTVLAAVHSA